VAIVTARAELERTQQELARQRATLQATLATLAADEQQQRRQLAELQAAAEQAGTELGDSGLAESRRAAAAAGCVRELSALPRARPPAWPPAAPRGGAGGRPGRPARRAGQDGALGAAEPSVGAARELQSGCREGWRPRRRERTELQRAHTARRAREMPPPRSPPPGRAGTGARATAAAEAETPRVRGPDPARCPPALQARGLELAPGHSDAHAAPAPGPQAEERAGPADDRAALAEQRGPPDAKWPPLWPRRRRSSSNGARLPRSARELARTTARAPMRGALAAEGSGCARPWRRYRPAGRAGPERESAETGRARGRRDPAAGRAAGGGVRACGGLSAAATRASCACGHARRAGGRAWRRGGPRAETRGAAQRGRRRRSASGTRPRWPSRREDLRAAVDARSRRREQRQIELGRRTRAS
jgi:hypothetical protein